MLHVLWSRPLLLSFWSKMFLIYEQATGLKIQDETRNCTLLTDPRFSFKCHKGFIMSQNKSSQWNHRQQKKKKKLDRGSKPSKTSSTVSTFHHFVKLNDAHNNFSQSNEGTYSHRLTLNIPIANLKKWPNTKQPNILKDIPELSYSILSTNLKPSSKHISCYMWWPSEG